MRGWFRGYQSSYSGIFDEVAFEQRFGELVALV